MSRNDELSEAVRELEGRLDMTRSVRVEQTAKKMAGLRD